MIGQVVTENLRLAAYGNCVINYWVGPATNKEFAAFDDFLSKVAEQHKNGVIFFVIVDPSTPIVTSEERKEMEALYTRWGPSLRAAAQVVEGGNLWSLTARSVMTALRLVQRRAYPTRVFADVKEGAEWVSQYVMPPANDNGQSPAHGILAQIEKVRTKAA